VPQHCTVCRSEHRHAIDLELARGGQQRAIASKYGVNEASLSRHRRNHLPVALLEAHLSELAGGTQDLERVASEERHGLLINLRAQRALLLDMQHAAKLEEKYHLATQISHVVHRNLEMIGRYLGEFAQVEKKSVTHLLLQDPSYIVLRSGLIEIARKYPMVRGELDALLQRVEGAHPHITGVPVRVLEAQRADAHG
jgi:hypothetical protein